MKAGVSVVLKSSTTGKVINIYAERRVTAENIKRFGDLIAATENVSLKCSLMIAFLFYAELQNCERMAIRFVRSAENALSKRVLTYYEKLQQENGIVTYLENTFKNIWYEKRGEVGDREIIAEVNKILKLKNVSFIK